MQNCKKRLLYVFMTLTLLLMQLSSALVAFADGNVAFTVADVGDAGLYAFLATATNSSDGVLRKEDAAKLSQIDTYGTSSEILEKIGSYANLASICPNIESISIPICDSIAKDAYASLMDEIVSLEKLTSINVRGRYLTGEQIAKIAKKNNADKLKFFGFDVNDTFDFVNVEGLTGVTDLSMQINGEVLHEESLKKLPMVREVMLSTTKAGKIQKMLDSLPDSTILLEVNSYVQTEDVETYDFSKITNMERIMFMGSAKELTGFSELNALRYIYVNQGMQVATNTYMDVSKLPASVSCIRAENCNIGADDLSSLPEYISEIQLKNSGLTSVAGIVQYPYLSTVDLEGNAITDITPMKDLANVRKLILSNNKISDISALSQSTGLEELRISDNAITQIPDLSKNENLSVFSADNNQIADMSYLIQNINLEEISLSNNRIQQIPDLSVLTKLKKLYLDNNQISALADLSMMHDMVGYNESNYYGQPKDSCFMMPKYFNFSLLGNGISKETLQGRVPEEYEKNQYWLYAAGMQSDATGHTYFTDLNTEIVSKTLEYNGYTELFTKQKEIVLDADLLKYLKDNQKSIDITYLAEKYTQKVLVYGSSLNDVTHPITISFSDIHIGTSTEELTEAFAPYGVVQMYYEVPKNQNVDIPGISYSSYVDFSLEKGKKYHIYKYNKEKKTFSFDSDFEFQGFNATVKNAGNDNIYFYVDGENDALMGVDHYLIGDNAYMEKNYYKLLNDTVINGLLDESSYVSITTTAPTVELSEDVVKRIKDEHKTFCLYQYNTDLHTSMLEAGINSYRGKDGAITVTFPKVEVSDTNANITFEGKVSKYYTISEIPENTNDVSYALNINNLSSEFMNTYVWHEGKAIPLGSSYISIDANTEKQYFQVAANEDEILKQVIVGENEQIHTFTYLTDTSSEYLAAYWDYASYGRSLYTIESQLTLSAQAVHALKNIGVTNVNFLDKDTGDSNGTVSIHGLILSPDEDGSMILEKPQITISTGNEEFEKAFPAGSSAIYVSPKHKVYKGVNYMFDFNTIKNKFLPNTEYVELQLMPNGEVRQVGTWNTGDTGISNLVTVNQTSAYMTVAEYKKIENQLNHPSLVNPVVTPSDTPIVTPTDTPIVTPTDTPVVTPTDTPVVTPTDTPVVTPTDTPSVEQEEPMESEKVTEAEEPTESEKATKVEQPTESEKETKVEQPTESEKATEAEKSTESEKATEAGVPTENEKTTEVETQTENIPQPTAQKGVYSVARTVAEEDLVNASSVNYILEERLNDSNMAMLDIISKGAAPRLSSNVFSKMKGTRKDITVGVTDENNRLQYAWSFKGADIENANMNLDLSITFDTDRADDIRAITGRTDMMYLSFAHHGELPAPARIKTYVGNQYRNGDVVYLYYFNEELNRVETVGNQGGLVVNEGYVEYTITHCSVYFLSQENAKVLQAVTLENNNVIQNTNAADPTDVNVADAANTKISAQTGDNAHVGLYVLVFLAAVLVFGTVVVTEKKRA